MNRTEFRKTALVAVFLAAAAGLGAATYSVTGGALALSYSPTGKVEATGSLTVTKPSSVRTRTFYIAFAESQAPATVGESLTYGIYSSSSSNTAISMAGRASTSKMLKLKFASSSSTSVTVSYVFRVSPTTFPGASTDGYTSIYSASLYTGSGTTALATSSQITTTVSVAKIAQVAVRSSSTTSYAFTTAGSDPNYALSLGDMSAGTTGAARILTRSNCGYELYLSSANSGTLVHSLDASSTVPYTVSVNKGSNLSLSSISKIATGSATYSSPVYYDLAVTIQSLSSNPAAGSYTDTITVTVAAL
jgi:hypothetical protein